jgi:ATP-dependent Lon protease
MNANNLTTTDKKNEIKSKTPQNNSNIYEFYINKLEYYSDVLSNVIVDLNNRVNYKYITNTESIICIEETRNVYKKINECYDFLNNIKLINLNTTEKTTHLHDNVSKLQDINDMINKIIRLYGCNNLEQLIVICFGSEYYTALKKEPLYNKQLLLSKYFHPTSFKCFTWKHEHRNSTYLVKNKIIDDTNITESADNFECFDLARTCQFFEQKITGIRVAYQNPDLKRTLIINGYIDISVDVKCINNPYIIELINALHKNKSLDVDINDEAYKNYIDMLSLKECLIYNTSELHKNYIGLKNQYELTKAKQISQVVSEFMNMELLLQIKFIKNLIINKHHSNSYYLCGILFGLLNDDVNGTISSNIQKKVYESLPYECQIHLKTIVSNYNEKTSLYKKFNINKIPYEQQIELLIADDEIKEKAYSKLKDVMAKSEESGAKAKAYLEGLLKIPFGIYKQEPLLKSKDRLSNIFSNLYKNVETLVACLEINDIHLKDIEGLVIIDKLSNINEGIKNKTVSFNEFKKINNNLGADIKKIILNVLDVSGNKLNRFDVKKKIDDYNTSIKSVKLKYKSISQIKNLKKINTTGKKKKEMLSSFLQLFSKNHELVLELYELCNTEGHLEDTIITKENIQEISEKILMNVICDNNFYSALDTLYKYAQELKTALVNINELRVAALNNIETCIYGHKNAKTQIKNIINQWITGENSGYCFGFEGPPGVGKTSIAKLGLTKCLEDEGGEYRPFDFIAIGGSTNGSYLNGHSYTYLGSSWGRIVEILMNKKCLNPIIFIDELDKVSNSEHGKEIIGILTHLVDPTQNNMYQDKYFSGINIDLSNALFIFSYNDPKLIDPILLDRIHRIKFDKLTPYDKLVICKQYLIKESNKRFGFSNDFIKIDDKTIMFLIDNYTYESGVRKLKQLLFEIWGNINELLLDGKIEKDEYLLTNQLLEETFLKEHHKMLRMKIPETPNVGIINGLWANALGLGGVTPIQIKWFPCKTPFELKLTGMQGDVMKESMNVAKTVAWDMLSKDELSVLWKHVYSEELCYGLHIHCPEGGVSKDGPSAGGAITTCLLSIFKNKPIRNTFAMTGEINLSGNITAIGGLEQKLYYGICAGATTFAFPEENIKEFELFKEMYEDKIDNFHAITFHPVRNIHDVYKIVFTE